MKELVITLSEGSCSLEEAVHLTQRYGDAMGTKMRRTMHCQLPFFSSSNAIGHRPQ